MSAKVQALESMDFELVLARDSTVSAKGSGSKWGAIITRFAGSKNRPIWPKNYLPRVTFDKKIT